MRGPWAALLLAGCAAGPEFAAGDSGGAWPSLAPSGAAWREPAPLEVRFLAVGGVVLTRGRDRVLTPPLYTNPDLLEVTLGTVASDPERVDRFLPAEWVEGAGAILVGHAHYDHLMDTPRVQELAGGPPIFGNRAVRWILGRGVVMNDPDAPLVDTRMCPDPDPCTGVPSGHEGAWVYLDGDRVRIRALCSSHPPQFLDVVHFGEGCMDAPRDTPPVRADNWKEGATLAWLVDFLDPAGAPVHRVYYQDAPTSGPVGHVHPDLLAEKGVDVAVLNVGSYAAVRDHPAEILANLHPRYVLGIHWEDFFRTLDEPLEPLPLQPSPEGFDARVEQALAPSVEPAAEVDGVPAAERYWRPVPGTAFRFPAEG